MLGCSHRDNSRSRTRELSEQAASIDSCQCVASVMSSEPAEVYLTRMPEKRCLSSAGRGQNDTTRLQPKLDLRLDPKPQDPNALNQSHTCLSASRLSRMQRARAVNRNGFCRNTCSGS